MAHVAAVLTDIEGTTTPIAFVHKTLFPFARARLRAYLSDHKDDPALIAVLREIAVLRPGEDAAEVLESWMDADAKIGPLKTLQGRIWRAGYESGDLRSEIYPDVTPALRKWHKAGIRLYVYSSGSVEAQKLIFRYSPAGDLTPLFAGYFDTETGGKRDAASYTRIARRLSLPPDAIMFLSDVEAELDAAASVEMLCCQLVRAQDGTKASAVHATARDFAAVPLQV